MPSLLPVACSVKCVDLTPQAWYEQKAVAILLTLLHLGIKNIHLGPSLPAFVTPAVLAFLQENFGIRPITEPEADLEGVLSVKA